MGYSCLAVDMEVYLAMIVQMQAAHGDAGGSSNSWGRTADLAAFAEIGRERRDGAVSGTVWAPTSPGRCRKAGSFRVAGGKVMRWPGSTAAMRNAAEHAGTCRQRVEPSVETTVDTLGPTYSLRGD